MPASVARSPSWLTLDVELTEERNPSIADSQIAEATLHLKGATLRAREASPEMLHSIHEIAEDIRRQVKRDREKRRGRASSAPAQPVAGAVAQPDGAAAGGPVSATLRGSWHGD